TVSPIWRNGWRRRATIYRKRRSRCSRRLAKLCGPYRMQALFAPACRAPAPPASACSLPPRAHAKQKMSLPSGTPGGSFRPRERLQRRLLNMAETIRDFIPVRFAVLTVSDSRTLADDRSGQTLAERIKDAGHELVERAIAPDESERIREIVCGWCEDDG